MPPKKKPAKKAAPKPVEAIVHDDKRPNLPTADAQDMVSEEVEAPQTVRYPRDPSLDPQLVWKGKDEQDGEDLEVDAPPIYIQEKIDPRVLVENLRRTAARPEDEPEMSLFDGFDGIDADGYDDIEFYEHDANWSNRMILGDSLQVMASLAERENLRGKVQMIYVDPPYGIKFGSNWQASARKRDVKDGKATDVAREVEVVKAFRDTWELGIHSYLTYLRDRLAVARDLLVDSGSCFLQIGDENIHLVRSVLDEVFGPENFVSQISFVTTSGFAQASALPRVGDHILWYAKDAEQLKYRRQWVHAPDRQGYTWLLLPDGSYRGMTAKERRGDDQVPADALLYKPDNILSQGAASEPQPFEFEGKVFSPAANSHWKANYPEGMNRLAAAGRIHKASNSIQYRRFVDDFPYQAQTNFWGDTGSGNFTDDKIYVVQTNTKVVERCMLLSTDPGDLVLDPTCGSGTTAFVAERWGRRWITVDSSRVAVALARQRLMGGEYPFFVLADSPEGAKLEGDLVGDTPVRHSGGGDLRQGFVCERVQRITLGSIANNPDVADGMTTTEIDAAIRKHADFEVLLDRPFEDSAKVRVAGPFTVESLSPHRSLAFADPSAAESEQAADQDPESADFTQTILDNLKAAGIQNGKRKERLTFESVDMFPGAPLVAVGNARSDDENDGAPRRVAIAVGPQYGTVSAKFIKKATRAATKFNKEAGKDEQIDLVCVLAFAFDPNAIGNVDDAVTSDESFADVAAERKLGKMPVLLVRMNADLAMGTELKKTGSGNLFTVFGEPDIKIKEQKDGQLVIDLKGVDVYDPTTGEIRSNDTSRIALWMIDSDYNGESFFVRHCYFTGGNDPYKRLKTALKADIDADAWASLYKTVSRPFPRPAEGKIAVKVINDYGDEVVKVFEV